MILVFDTILLRLLRPLIDSILNLLDYSARSIFFPPSVSYSKVVLLKLNFKLLILSLAVVVILLFHYTNLLRAFRKPCLLVLQTLHIGIVSSLRFLEPCIEPGFPMLLCLCEMQSYRFDPESW